MAFSSDGGQTFGVPDEVPGDNITSLLVLDDETWWAGDTAGLLWMTDDAGDRSWDDYEINAGAANDVTSLAVSGDKALAGTVVSEAFFSEDAGETWDQVDTGTKLPVGGNAATYVCFDDGDDNIAYAASDDTLARFTDLSDLGLDWEAWDTTFYTDTNGNLFDDDDLSYGLTVASGVACLDGVVYASSGDVYNTASITAEGAFMRIVNPLADLDDVDGSDVDAVIGGRTTANAEDFAGGLQVTAGSNELWGLDVDDFTLWTYTDLMVGPVTALISDPGDTDATLSWNGFDNASDWEVKVYSDEDMRAVYQLYDQATGDDEPLLILNAGNAPDAGTEYWWQVRASAPVHSKWSAVRSFSTDPGDINIDEDRLAPPLGAMNVPTDTPFSWGFIEAADSYYIEISDISDFSNIIDSATVTVPAYRSSVTLSECTNYWYRVYAVASGQKGNPAYSSFTTECPEGVAPTPAAPTPSAPIEVVQETITPNYIYAIIGIGAALAILVIVLITKVKRP